jgi:hypothetical protein
MDEFVPTGKGVLAIADKSCHLLSVEDVSTLAMGAESAMFSASLAAESSSSLELSAKMALNRSMGGLSCNTERTQLE